LTFTASDGIAPWNIPQTVTITAVDDQQVEAALISQITHSTFSTDPSYQLAARVLPVVTVHVQDNDMAAARVSSATLIVEEGASAVYTLSLATAPRDVVTVEVSASDSSCTATTSGVLTPGNWESGIPITVRTLDNAIAGENPICTITHSFRSSDPFYNLESSPEVVVSIEDDDQAGFGLNRQTLTLAEGQQANYTVTLNSEPLAPVRVFAIPDGSGCTIAVSETLNAENWAEGVRVTVQGVDNQVAEGERRCTIRHVLLSQDQHYFILQPDTPRLIATILDNDQANVVARPETLSITEGNSATFTLRLISQPTAPVNVMLSNSDSQCSAAVTGVLDEQNWKTGIPITVSVPENTIADGARSCRVGYQLSSADQSDHAQHL